MTGNTTINGGGLTISENTTLKFTIGANGVNNKVTGTGTVTLNGKFDIDVGTAGTTFGNSWSIVDVGTLNETFGATFGFQTPIGFLAEISCSHAVHADLFDEPGDFDLLHTAGAVG